MKTPITLNQIMLLIILCCVLGNTKMIAQPINDLIENAIDLSEGPIEYLEFDVDFVGATITNDSGQQGCSTGVAGVWYKFTATAAGEITARIGLDDEPIVVFYSGPNENVMSGQELTHVDQPNNQCEVSNESTIQTTIGVTYYIFMKNNVGGDVEINTAEVFAAPANDFIENAIDMNGQENFVDSDVHFLMVTATNDGGQIGCNAEGAASIWYKFTAEVSGEVTVEMNSEPLETVLIFYSAADENATSGAELTHVIQQTNPCDAGNQASIIAEAGTTYYLLARTIKAYANVNVNLNGVLGISENTIDGFSFYPNPVTSEINISAKNTIEEVTIFNILGQKVYAEKLNATKRNIELSFLETGMYVMQVSSEGITGSYKIIKK